MPKLYNASMRFRWLNKVWCILSQSNSSTRLKYSASTRKVIQLAEQEANRLNHEYVGTDHLLLGILVNDNSVAALALKGLGIEPSQVRCEVETLIVKGTGMVPIGKLPLTPRARNVIKYSIEEAHNLNHNYVGTGHILIGLLREQEGFAGTVLMNLGLTLENTCNEVIQALADNKPPTGV